MDRDWRRVERSGYNMMLTNEMPVLIVPKANISLQKTLIWDGNDHCGHNKLTVLDELNLATVDWG